MPKKILDVLIAFDQPEILNCDFERRFPEHKFHYATNKSEIVNTLEKVNPSVALSIKHPPFPPQHHLPLREHPSLEWIHVGGSGYDHFIPWNKKRLTITNSQGVLARFLAETCIGAMLALNGNFLTYIAQKNKRHWEPQSFSPLQGKTLLIVGVGAIGGYVSEFAKALGMRVIGIRGSGQPHPSVDEMYMPNSLLDVIGEADFLSLHVRLNNETTQLIDKKVLNAMKKNSFLLNTARGPVVDEKALCDALHSKHLGGAYLDVFENEPLPDSSPLWQMKNVLITPHAADAVFDWPARYASIFCDNLEHWTQGEPLINVVD